MDSFAKMFSLNGKKALIAGASRGIGLAIAQATAAHGAHTVLASRSKQKLDSETAALKDKGYSAESLELDITNNDSIDDAAEACANADILVNVAGTNMFDESKQRVVVIPMFHARMNDSIILHGALARSRAA